MRGALTGGSAHVTGGLRGPALERQKTLGTVRAGRDLGYQSHDATGVDLYFQETLTFLAHTSEAAVTLSVS